MMNMELSAGDRCYTPYGEGKVEVFRRAPDGLCEVALDWHAKAVLQPAQVRARKELYEMTMLEKSSAARARKQEANALFKEGRFQDALAKYELAHVYLRHFAGEKDEADPGAEEETALLLNNLALTHGRLGHHAEAVNACTEALRARETFVPGEVLPPVLVKTLYLRAVALRKRAELDAAARDLVRAIRSAPQNKAIRDEYESLKVEQAAVKAKEAQMFRGAFAKPSSGKVEEADNDGKSKRNSSSKEREHGDDSKQGGVGGPSNRGGSPDGGWGGFFEQYGTILLSVATVSVFAMAFMSRMPSNSSSKSSSLHHHAARD